MTEVYEYCVRVNTIALLCVKDSEICSDEQFFRVAHKSLTAKMQYGMVQ